MDAVGAGLGPGELQQGHGHHHHAHQDLEDIVDEGLEAAQVKLRPHDHPAAEVEYRHRGPVHGQHHHRQDGDDPQSHRQGGLHQLVVGFFELFPLEVLPDEGLDHPDGHQVLLEGVVQVVDALLHGLKEFGTQLHQNPDDDHHNRDDHRQHQGQPGVERDADGQGGNEHHRGPHQHPQPHGQHHGHGVHVVGHAGDEGGGGEAVDVRKRELLHLVKQALPQVGAEALAGDGGVFGRAHAAGHGDQGQRQHGGAQDKDRGLISGGNGGVHNLRHDQREQQFADDLQNDQDGGENCLPLVALEMGQKQLKQEDDRPFLGVMCARRRFYSPAAQN